MNDAEKRSEILRPSDEVLKKELTTTLSKLLDKSDANLSSEVFDQSLLEQLDPAFVAATEGYRLMPGFDMLNHDEQLTGLSVVTDALAKYLRPRSYRPPSRLITPIRQQLQRVSTTEYRSMAPTTLEVTKKSANGAIEIKGQRFDFSQENTLYTISSVVSSDDGRGPGKAAARYTWNTLSNEVASRLSNLEYADMLFIDPTKSDLENMTFLAKRLEGLRASNNT